MHCCVPFCTNASNNVLWKSHGKGDGTGISFHGFPSEAHLRNAWLGSLGILDTDQPESAVVCSRHFLDDDIYVTETGLRQISAGAIPTTVLICVMCLKTDCEMLLMSKYKLVELYEKFIGTTLQVPSNLKQTVCVPCAQTLSYFSQLRERSLRAMMMRLAEKDKS